MDLGSNPHQVTFFIYTIIILPSWGFNPQSVGAMKISRPTYPLDHNTLRVLGESSANANVKEPDLFNPKFMEQLYFFQC